MLNKAKGQMYGFITHTWNPIKGACPYQCSYCYMKKIWRKTGKPAPKPKLYEEELKTNLGVGNYIFVGSSIDLFAEAIRPYGGYVDIPKEWIERIIRKVEDYPYNTYLWHTKNPFYAVELLPVRENYILCTTIESNRSFCSVLSVPSQQFRIPSQYTTPEIYKKYQSFRKMITVEPIMDFDMDDFITMIKMVEPFQVNIGADSGNNRLPEPPKEKVLELISRLEKFTKVYQKPNLGRLLK